jgi:hypothetical protein
MGIRRPKKSQRTLACLVAAAGSVAGLTLAHPARADEPRKVSEPKVLREPSEIVQVVDAFDDDDMFDLHLSLGYQHTWKSANILRETSVLQAGLGTGGYTVSNMNVASYEESTARLNTRADIGVYKDIAIVVRMPVILSNNRKLDDLEGSADQQSLALAGGPGEQLFSLPFESPTRSGIEYLAIGMDFGIMNQARNKTKPTWIIGGEVRLNVSEPMHACNKKPTPLNLDPDVKQVTCAHPNDIDRDGNAPETDDLADGGFHDPVSGVQLDEGPGGTREAGVSRGMTALNFHTYLSRRVKYIEPYGGFDVLFEFPNDSSDYKAVDLKGSLVNHPPLRGSMIVGIAVIPWEIRDAFQRVTIDGRFTGSYVSEGRDYTELFDALGTSDAPSMRYPQFAEYQENTDPSTAGAAPSVVDPGSQKVYFTGLTDVQQHGVYQFSVNATYQAGEYVKFNLGGGWTLVQGHFITFDQACNPDFDNDEGASGPCRTGSPADPTTGDDSTFSATGIPNPNYRRPINDPGHRFKVDDATALDLWISATVMF